VVGLTSILDRRQFVFQFTTKAVSAYGALTLLAGRQEVRVGVVICLERGAVCLHMVQLMPLHPKSPSSLASFKSGLVLPFWYRVFRENRPLNGCSSTSSSTKVARTGGAYRFAGIGATP